MESMRSRYRTSGAKGSSRYLSRSSTEVVPSRKGPTGLGRVRLNENTLEARARSSWRCILKG